MFPRGRSSVFREAESLCTEEKKHRALPGVRVFYQKISRKIIEALCSFEISVFRNVLTIIAHVGAVALCTEIGVSSVLQGDFLQKHRALPGVRVFYQKISRKIIEALCSITSSVFRKVITMCREGSGSPV